MTDDPPPEPRPELERNERARRTSAPRHGRPMRQAGLLDPRMLELLVCPLTRGRLEWRPDAQELVSRRARLAFPVRDGVPILLASEAREIDEAELERRSP